MTVRDTSLDAYAIALPKMPARQRQILAYLVIAGPRHITRAALAKGTGIPLQSVCSVTKRLIEIGMVEEKPRAPCPVTGNDGYGLWVPPAARERLGLDTSATRNPGVLEGQTDLL